MLSIFTFSLFFFFNDTATTEIYTLSLHDALPISQPYSLGPGRGMESRSHSRRRNLSGVWSRIPAPSPVDRKSTRLNSSHGYISYAVFCLKKKKKIKYQFTSYHTCCKPNLGDLHTV